MSSIDRLVRRALLATLFLAVPGVAQDAPVAGAGTPAPFAGAVEVLEEPGFLVHYQNCDATLPTADRLTLPRRLSTRYNDMKATVRAELTEGRPANIVLLEGDEPLFEAIRWHVERARFAPGPPACVMLHYAVTDTVTKASDIVAFRVWADVAVGREGQIEGLEIVDELASDQIRAAIVSQVSTWMLEPVTRDGVPVPFETSLRVGVKLVPNGWDTYSIATELRRRGPRPTRTKEPRFPRRLASLATRGTVVLEFMVSEKGKPIDPKVVKSTPPGVFDQQALGTILGWRYKPDVIDGKPTMTGPVRQAIQFQTNRPLEKPEIRSRIQVGG